MCQSTKGKFKISGFRVWLTEWDVGFLLKPSLWAWCWRSGGEQPPCWILVAFRSGVRMSSSLNLITPSPCVWSSRHPPCILITVGVGAKKEVQGGELSGRKGNGVVWSRVRGECKVRSVSCIYCKAQDAACRQERPWPEFTPADWHSLWLIIGYIIFYG